MLDHVRIRLDVECDIVGARAEGKQRAQLLELMSHSALFAAEFVQDVVELPSQGHRGKESRITKPLPDLLDEGQRVQVED
jgi:hypothetical protein